MSGAAAHEGGEVGGGTEAGGGADDSHEALARRRSLTIPGDTMRGTLFLGMLDTVREGAGEAAVRRCLAVGDEPRFVEFFAYPLSAFLRVQEVAAAELARGGVGWSRALRLLGRRAGVDLLTSVAGRALRLMSAGDSRRLLGQVPSAYRVALNHGERSVVWEGPSRGRVVMRRDFMPRAFHEGVLTAMLESTGAQGVRVHGVRLDVLDGEYQVEWE